MDQCKSESESERKLVIEEKNTTLHELNECRNRSVTCLKTNERLNYDLKVS